MDFDQFIERYFWLLCIAVTVANALSLKVTARKEIAREPRLSAGYRTLVRGVLFWGNLPWVVMGAGILLGQVSGVSAYLRLRSGNPFVVAFAAVLVAEWILGFNWLFARRGAEHLVAHTGLLRGRPSATWIRIGYSLGVAGGTAALLMGWYR